MFGEKDVFVRVCLVNFYDPVAHIQGCFNAISKARASSVGVFTIRIIILMNDQPIYDNLNCMHFVAVKLDVLINIIDFTVNADTHKTSFSNIFQ